MLSFSEKSLLAPGILEEQNYNLKTRGYGLVPSFLSAHECEILKSELIRRLEEYQPVKESKRSILDRHQLHDLINYEINFARLLEDPRLQQLVSPHLGEHWIMYAATSSSIPPKGTNYSSRLHIDSPRFCPNYIFNMGVIWTLDDYNIDNGALEVLPGSHHDATQPSEEFFNNNKHDDHFK